MNILSSFKRLLLVLAMVYWSDSNAEAGMCGIVIVRVNFGIYILSVATVFEVSTLFRRPIGLM